MSLISEKKVKKFKNLIFDTWCLLFIIEQFDEALGVADNRPEIRP
jgi:hypothetical protein